MDPPAMADVLEVIVCTEDADDLQRIVTAYPSLVEDETLQEMGAKISGAEGAALAYGDVLVRRLSLCREQGAAAAVASVPALIRGLPGVVPDSLRGTLRPAYTSFAAYQESNDRDALESAAEIWQTAIVQPEWTELDDEVQRALLGDWGAVRLAQYSRSGNRIELDGAIDIYERILAEPVAGKPSTRAKWLGGLSSALQQRYLLQSAGADLDRAVELASEAVRSASEADASTMQFTLAAALRLRSNVGSDAEDIDHAVEAARAAVQQLDSSPRQGDFQSSLGLSLMRRYEQSGSMADLDEAVAAFTASRASCPPDAPSYPSICNNLGIGLLTQFERDSAGDHLDRAIEALRAGTAATLDGDVRRPAHLSNLSGALASRFRRTRHIEDLLDAHEAAKSAVDSTATGPELVDYLTNFGSVLLDLDEVVPGESTALDEAIEALERAVDTTESTWPQRPVVLKSLGDALVRRHDRDGDTESALIAVMAYKDACSDGLEVRPEAALLAARAWIGWALRRDAWDEAKFAGQQGERAAQRLLRKQLLRHHSVSFLRDLGDLPSQLALAYGMTGEVSDALLALETGRALLLSEALERDREDLDRLADAGRSDLLASYRALSARIDEAERLPQRGDIETAAIPSSGDARTLRAGLDALVEEIRAVPGYSDFLDQPTLDDVFTATDAPLVYLFITEVGGAAFAVLGGQKRAVHAIGLPDLSSGVVRGWLEDYFRAYDARRDDPSGWADVLDRVTRQLWTAGIGRVIDEVAAIPGVSRAVFVPLGLLGLLPLHAAWTSDSVDGKRRYALDSLSIAYAPNARVARVARERAGRIVADRLVLVGAAGVGAHQLASVEAELAAVAGHFPAVHRIDGPSGDKAAVLEALRTSTVLHVAAHGQAQLSDPLDSGVQLADGDVLTLRDILDLHLTRSSPSGGLRLAVLSACETAVVATDLPDESIGLGTGLIQAGAAGVVATLWAVPDETAMALMTQFYRLWREEGVAPAQALNAAQHWLREASNNELCNVVAEFSNRRPQGNAASALWGTARPFAGIRHWAAFTFVGA